MKKVDCSACQRRPAGFTSGKAQVCRQCKVHTAVTKVLGAPYTWTWTEEEEEPLLYAVYTLRHFYWATVRYGGLSKIVGPTLARQFSEHWDLLLFFAREEDEAYGFSPTEHSLARLELECAPSPHALDFWLTVCAAFDMRNYLYDVRTYAREQMSTKATPPRRSMRNKHY